MFPASDRPVATRSFRRAHARIDTRAVLLASLVLTGCADPGAHAEPETPPNIVLIVADDAGYGDFSVYGQSRLQTPSVDRLANEGLRFTQFYAGSTVCAPSRSVLMTGLHTGHTFIRGNSGSLPTEFALPPGQDVTLADSVVTLAERLRAAGYATGAFGKWGLGAPGTEGAPGNQGIDEFFGYLSQRAAHYYFPESLWQNDSMVTFPENANGAMRTYSHDVIQDRALQFLEVNADGPFFLYLPFTIPHAEVLAPDDSVLQRFAGAYAETPVAEAAANEEYYGQRYATPALPRANRAAMVTRLDRTVGAVLARLEELGIDDRTIVLFTSDNGPSAEGRADVEFFDSNGPLRGGKRDLYEGGIRVPMVIRWPGRIEPGRVTEHVATFWDLLPTLTELAGAPVTQGIDGHSIVPTLIGAGEQPVHEYLYWEFSEQGGKQAVRWGDWKGIRLQALAAPGQPLELYDLATDPAEERNVAAENAEIVARLEAFMTQAHTPSTLFPGFD